MYAIPPPKPPSDIVVIRPDSVTVVRRFASGLCVGYGVAFVVTLYFAGIPLIAHWRNATPGTAPWGASALLLALAAVALLNRLAGVRTKCRLLMSMGELPGGAFTVGIAFLFCAAAGTTVCRVSFDVKNGDIVFASWFGARKTRIPVNGRDDAVYFLNYAGVCPFLKYHDGDERERYLQLGFDFSMTRRIALFMRETRALLRKTAEAAARKRESALFHDRLA